MLVRISRNEHASNNHLWESMESLDDDYPIDANEIQGSSNKHSLFYPIALCIKYIVNPF